MQPALRSNTAASLPSDSAAFDALVFDPTLLVGALCFLPALALGPIVEALRH
ncbi:MAG: potassium-transporting ATPase subunit KdpA [Bryobacteraceae bacterium]|jgi:K+-transporting ATPase A subunit